MATEIEAARQFDVPHLHGARRRSTVHRSTSMSKYFASEMSERVTSEALQILGGAGFTTLHPSSDIGGDARLTKIFEGTSEIQQRIISDILLGKPTSILGLGAYCLDVDAEAVAPRRLRLFSS